MLRDDLFNKEWCDIIFDGKNKSYGAYIIRKSSAKRHTIAMIWVLAAVAMFFLLPTIIVKLMSLGNDDNLDIAQVTTLSKLQKPPVIKIKEVKPKIDLTPKEPDAIKDKNIVRQIKFVAPIISRDDEVTTQDLARSQEVFDPNKLDLINDKKDTAQYALPEELIPDIKPDEALHYDVIDNLPEYPGGQQAMMTYLSGSIKYPFWAQRYNMQGQVTIQFIVNTDGSLSDCRVIRGAGVYLNNEALRVVRAMPKWIPAKKKGKPVRSRCVIPVVFRLN